MLFDTKINYKLIKDLTERKTNLVLFYLQICVAFSSCMLKSSCSWILHTSSINVVFFDGLNCLVLRATSCLDAFSTYSLMRGCPASPWELVH